MIKARTIKLYPTKEQTDLFEKQVGCCRFVYNKMLEINQKVYHRTGKGLSGYDMSKRIIQIRNQYKFLGDVAKQPLQISCYNLAEAYNRFFKKIAKYPKFKKKGCKDSFTYCNNLEVKDNKLFVIKAKWVKYRGGDDITGRLIKATIFRKAENWYASIIYDDGIETPEKKSIKDVIGIDLGLTNLITLSNGEKVKALKADTRKLKKWQKALARKKKNSIRYKECKRLVAKYNLKIANKRKHYIHEVIKKLIDSPVDTFGVESLNVKGMMSNHKLARAIADVSWSEFIRILNYKCEWSGKNLLKVDRFYPSSKICSNCGVVKESLSLSERTFICPSCDNQVDRDVNASINIIKESLKNSELREDVRLYPKAIFGEERRYKEVLF